MKIALVTDTHFGARNDSTHFLDYFEEFYSKQFFPKLEAEGIKTVVHLGDIVDRRKYINYVTLRRMKDMFIDECEKRGIALHVIVGNHDVPFKDTNEWNSMNELFDNTFVEYYSKPETLTFDGHDILIMPWINKQNYDVAIDAMDKTPAQVMFGHLEIAGCLMNVGMPNPHGMRVSDFDKFDLVCSGHFHHKSTTKNVEYLGCPYELTWADFNDAKGFHIYDTDTRGLEFVRNPNSMFKKVFYSDDNKSAEEVLDFPFDSYKGAYVKVIKQTVDNPYWFDLFMDKLYKADPIHIQIVEDHLNLNLEDDEDIVNEAEDTITIMNSYISNYPDNVPKDDLSQLMSELYNEAIHMDA